MTDSPEIAEMLRLLDEGFDHEAWHGPNLRGSLRRMPALQAAWRPAPGQRNAWEIALHAAYWKYSVWRRVTGGKRSGFPVKGSDWFERPAPTADPAAWSAAWAEDQALLDGMHARLREAVAAFPAERLDEVPAGSTLPFRNLIAGAALHDVYHAGQVQALKHLHSAIAR